MYTDAYARIQRQVKFLYISTRTVFFLRMTLHIILATASCRIDK